MSPRMTPGQIRWRCRRGMRELDGAMLAYFDTHYADATDGERKKFEDLLSWQDPELYRLVSGKDKEACYQPIIDKINATLADVAVRSR